MAIEIVITNEDLKTILPISSQLGSIDSNDDFYTLVRIAKESKLAFIPTIDAYGYTIINDLQIEPFKNEIQILRHHPKVKQSILDTLQEAVDAVNSHSHEYLMFMGD